MHLENYEDIYKCWIFPETIDIVRDLKTIDIVRDFTRRRRPRKVVLCLNNLEDINKDLLRNFLRNVQLLLVDAKTAEIIGNLENIENYIILENSFRDFVLKTNLKELNPIISSENGRKFLIITSEDIVSIGKNDKNFFEKLENLYNIRIFPQNLYKKPLPIILFFFENLLRNIESFPENISTEIRITRENFEIGGKEVTGLQIFKCDRFTGLTTSEGNYTTRKFTLRTSKEVSILLLAGLVSSYITKAKNYYLFLFFSQEDFLRICNIPELLEKYYLIKENIIELLRKTYSRTIISENVLLEILLNTKIQELLDQYNLDKVSFILFRIARERQTYTYKIYEQQYLSIQRNFPFRELVEKYFRHPIELIRRLNNVIKDKNSELWKACRRFWHERGGGESDNAFRAIQGLYRFVVLGDLSGYYQFLREIRNCYEKSNGDSTRNYRKIKEYKKIMKEFGDVV